MRLRPGHHEVQCDACKRSNPFYKIKFESGWHAHEMLCAGAAILTSSSICYALCCVVALCYALVSGAVVVALCYALVSGAVVVALCYALVSGASILPFIMRHLDLPI